jgi:AcrR family transcriptional regulator
VAVENDRRVRRTRKLLREAFIDLVLEKGYEKTTVQDILDRADIGRSTFYSHFRDKEALLLACFDNLRQQLRSDMAAMALAGPIDVSRPAALIFQHASRQKRMYGALCGKQGGRVVERHLRSLVSDILLERLSQYSLEADVPAAVAAEYYTAAAWGLLVWWVDHDFCRGHAWLTEVYRRLALPAGAQRP